MNAHQDPKEMTGRIDAATLFREHAAFIARFVRRLGTPQAAVDDVVQEVFLIAHRKGGYVQGDAHPRTWLAAIAINVVRSERRALGRRQAEANTPQIERAHTIAPDPDHALETQRSLERVQTALDTLDPDHRATFILYEIEGASSESIAAALEVPVGTVYSRLHHARKRFLQAHTALQKPPHTTTTGSTMEGP